MQVDRLAHVPVDVVRRQAFLQGVAGLVDIVPSEVDTFATQGSPTQYTFSGVSGDKHLENII